MIGEWTLGKKLGEGAFTKVRLGTNGSRKVAIRVFDKSSLTNDPADHKVLARERSIVPLLDHPNIAKVHSVEETPSSVIFIMEYCPDGDLFELLDQKQVLTEPEARRIFRQLVSAVAYIHRANIVHRDLKLDNVLLRGSVVKLIDFGFCNLAKNGHMMRTACGTPVYAAPEVLSGKQYVGKPVDIWSLGVMLYTLVIGQFPFAGTEGNEVWDSINKSKANCPPDLPDTLSDSLTELLKGMMAYDPDARFTLDAIVNNEWFKVDAAEDPENTTLWKIPGQKLKDAINELHQQEMLLMHSMPLGWSAASGPAGPPRPHSLRSSRSSTSTRSSTPPRRNAMSGPEGRAKRSSIRSRNSRNSLGGISEDLAGERRAGPIGRPSSENMSHVMPHLRTLNGSASFTSLPGLARADDDSISAHSHTPSAGSRSSMITSSSAGSSGSIVSGPSVPSVPLGASRRGSATSNGTTRLLTSTGLRSHVPPQPSKLARESSGKFLHTLHSPDSQAISDSHPSPSSLPQSPLSPADSPLSSPKVLPPPIPPAGQKPSPGALKDKAPPPPRPIVPGSHVKRPGQASSAVEPLPPTGKPKQVPPIRQGTVKDAVKFFSNMPNGGVAGIGTPPPQPKSSGGIRGPLRALVGRKS